MDYESVRKIIGWEGSETSTIGDTTTYRWEDKGGVIACTFTNGLVSAKTHHGIE